MSESEHPAITVYLAARVFDSRKSTSRMRKRKGRKVRVRSGGMRHCWSLRLQRWTPEEVQRIIIETFTRLAQEDEIRWATKIKIATTAAASTESPPPGNSTTPTG